jgi:hypothetical protein
MDLSKEYIKISDLYESVVSRSAQLASMATVLQDAIANPDSSPKALYETAWLMAELLNEHRQAILQLQDFYMKNYNARQSN